MGQVERITSRQNPLLQHLVKLQNSAGERRRSGEMVGDGWKLLTEAARYGNLQTVVYAKGQTPPQLPADVRLVEVPAALLKAVSQMQTPQGVLFIAARPAEASGEIPTGSLILDGVQDPGNVGTILRTADGLGIDGVILSADCPEITSPKVLRATMGGVFHQLVMVAPQLEPVMDQLKEEGFDLCAAALTPEARPVGETPFGQRAAVVIGNEGNGLPEEIIRRCSRSVIIPMARPGQSLNAAVAGCILMWELVQSR